MPNFHAIIDRSGTSSLKWEKYAGEDILPMWVADMDFTSPACVMDALRERVNHGVFGYTMPPDELANLVCTRFRHRYDWPVEPEWLVWLPGIVPGLSAACTAYTDPEDEIATFTPIYPPFLQ
ncbi:MAG: aspartate aminotransferase, partial [bacterium]